jgi:plastocyanin
MQKATLRCPWSSIRAAHRALLSALVLSAFLAAACHGKGEDGVAVADASGTAVAAAPITSSSVPEKSPAQPGLATGRTIDVQMIGDASGYRFVPATVTIKAGDTVRWTNVSGGPHNVTFWSDSIPKSAAARLQANMTQPMSPLSGPLLAAPNATYSVSFAGLSAGRYSYYCMPHLALGMKATVVVE